MELDKRYDHKILEEGMYEKWISLKLFQIDASRTEKFSIVIPPPNVTGKLHLGHAWDNTLQDILIRFHHALGKDVVYLPGMDHAGIATQAVVESKLREQGISRYDLGRKAFLAAMWKWKDEYALNIRKQWGKLGLALHYDLERFTLDEGLSSAVKEVFVQLYNEGLIYRGERIINWDPEQRTALSNVEVIHKEIEGKLYYFNYPLKGSNIPLIVATTRPETMFADVCLVVNPTDERFKHLIGQEAFNPSNGEYIPIIGDAYVDISFGTGVMKCTPAHDANDFQISIRHQLARPMCIEIDGKIGAKGHKYQGLDRFIARKQLVEDLTAQGYVTKIESIVHAVGHSERSDAIVEPYMSLQWFVKMKPLAQKVIDLQASDDKIHFFPERFGQTLLQWMEKVEDWCISRQLWWGHQIPAWYHKETKEVYVGLTPPEPIEDYVQDEDVLDTWFSSALWPFSTLGWPDETPLLKDYYPTSTMVTGYDIIFFWVARMAFQSLHFLKKKPFTDVLVHGIIRDAQGRKMSKSLGNGVDPIQVIDKFGTDALRIYLATNSSPGQDTRYIEEKVESQANYLNKVWNSARFILSYIDEKYEPNPQLDHSKLHMIDLTILKRCDEVMSQVKDSILKYEIGFASTTIYNFVYDEFCSWYIEFSKIALNGVDLKRKRLTIDVLITVLKNVLLMLHPFAPFITEAIYSKFPGHKDSIYQEVFTSPLNISVDERYYQLLKSMITDIRSYKVNHQLPPNAHLELFVESSLSSFLEIFKPYLERFSFSLIAKEVSSFIGTDTQSFVYSEGKLFIKQKIDIEKLKTQLLEQEKTVLLEIKRATSMLSNQNFIAKAPPKKIEEENDKLKLYQAQLVEIQLKLNQLD
jgi:valyl-tRNA synthetase